MSYKTKNKYVEDRETILCYLPVGVKQKLKIKCEEEARTISGLMRSWVNEYLKEGSGGN